MRPLQIGVPGDKSIAHRSLMFAALADGESQIRGLPDGLDVRSTAACLGALGVSLTQDGPVCRVRGVGVRGFVAPCESLDCGNSGTTIRLLSGLLAGSPITVTLTGDESLCGRPMGRVIDPLMAMGARIMHQQGRAPLTISGGDLTGHTHQLSVASAQVKSAILLAGLSAKGPTVVIEPGPGRDHTERLLQAMGAPIEVDGNQIVIHETVKLAPLTLTIPGDPSSAAYWLALGVFGRVPVTVADIAVNRTRVGFIDMLRQSGARVQAGVPRDAAGEPVASVTARPGMPGQPLRASGSLVVRAIDELPLAMIMSALVPGRSEFRDAAELRVKECDRIAAVADNLQRLGAQVEQYPDGLAVDGGRPLRAAELDSFGDHRIAMSLGVLAAVTGLSLRIQGAAAAAVSYPGFFAELAERTGATPVVA